jgi:pyrroloquinoline quinone biosynthesis protein E
MFDRHSLALSELTIEITRKCPLKCLICSSNGGSSYTNELGTDELKRIISDAHTLGATTVSFSGGEPLEHSHITDLCRYAKKQALNVNVYTSGNALNENHLIGPIDENILASFERMRLDKMIFGLQGPDEKVHDMITGVNGSFRNVIASIKRTVKRAIPTEIHSVPVRLNYKSLPRLVVLARKLQIRQISLLRFVPQGRGEINKDILSLNRQELLTLKSMVKKMLDSKDPKIRIGAPFNAFGFSVGVRCAIGRSRATVRADGCVFPCEAAKELQGSFDNDLHTRSLRDIWENSRLFEEARNISHLIDKTVCKECRSFGKCGGGCLAQRFVRGSEERKILDPYCLKAGVIPKDVYT